MAELKVAKPKRAKATGNNKENRNFEVLPVNVPPVDCLSRQPVCRDVTRKSYPQLT